MTPQESSPLKRTGIFAVLGLGLLCLYAATSPRGTTPEDASEFILTAFFKGLPHPPGYPLFVWLGHFCSFLPWGTPAQKIAFLSHLAISGTALVWGVWAYRLFQNTLLSSWVILSFGLAFPIWSSAQLVEVYPLHTFLLSLTFFLAFEITQTKKPSPVQLSLFGLFLGLSLSNHYPLVVLSFPAFGVLFYPVRKTLWRLSCLGWMLLGLLVGLIPYTHLWTAHHNSQFLFSGPLLKFSDFFDYVLRKEYAQNDKSKVFSFRELGLYSLESLKILFWAFSPVVFLAGVFGTQKVFKKSETSRLPLAFFLGLLSSFTFLFIFWRPDYYLLAIELFETFHGFALGCFLLLSTSGLWSFFKTKKNPKAYLWALFLIPLFLLMSNWKKLNRQNDTFAEDYASLILDSLPPRALLLVKGDVDAGILAYSHFLEKKRPDISLISQVSALLPQKPFDRATDISHQKHQVGLLNVISAHLDMKRPVFSIGAVEYFSPENSPFPLKTKNYGIFREIYDQDPAPLREFSGLVSQEAKFLNKAMSPGYEANFKHYRNRAISDVCHGLLISGLEHPAFENLPTCKLLKAQWLHVEKKEYESADKLFREAIERSSLAQDSELAAMGKDFLVNRLKWLESIPEMSAENRRNFLEETFQVALPLALQFRSCKNPLVPKLITLALQSGFSEIAEKLRKKFPC